MAACLITNAHYTGIYPTDLIANGGLIGDVLFFAVSGYCLYNVKNDLSVKGFSFWYGKRIWRVYPPVLIMTGIYMAIGAYRLSEHGVVWWYLFPTYYHFVASIVLLYIPFFFIVKIDWLKKRIVPVMAVIGAAWLIVYFVFYDRSYYHIDTVREPMIRFLFFESMLFGAWFRQNDERIRNRFSPIYPLVTLAALAIYFVSKTLFSKRENLAQFQIANQFVILFLLFFLFRTFCSLDGKLERMPSWLKRAVKFLSDRTLEIYVVQYVLIDLIRDLDIVFPLNWLAVTVSIIAAAFALHFVCGLLYRGADGVIAKIKSKREKNDSGEETPDEQEKESGTNA